MPIPMHPSERYQIYMSDRVERAERVAKRQAKKAGINLGNTTDFAHPDGYPQGVPLWGELADDWSVVNKRRLLTATINDITGSDRGPGSWVLSFQAHILELGTAAAVTCPLVAVISYGCGGATQEIEVDAFRNIVAIPADTFNVEIGWGRPGSDDQAEEAPYSIPLLTRVSALAHRSLETGEGTPTRTMLLIPNHVDQGQPTYSKVVPIPPQATSWTVTTPSITLPTDDFGAAFAQAAPPSSSAPVVDDSVPNDVLVAMIRGRCYRDLPATSRYLYFPSLPFDLLSNQFATLTFKIGV